MEDAKVQNKRLMKNTIILYLRMFFMLALSLYTSRVILQVLGVEDFGTYNVIGGLLGMFSVVTASLTTGASRFITYSIGKNDLNEMKATFGGVLFIQIMLALVILLLSETIGLWYFYEKLIIPQGREIAAFWVFQFSILGCMTSLLATPFNAEIIAHEKMQVFAYFSLFDAVVKLLIVYLLMFVDVDKLILYSALLLIIQIIDTLIYAIYCKCHFAETHGKVIMNSSLTKELLKYSGWTMTGGITSVANNHGLNLLLNLFFGPAVNAARGLSSSVQYAILNFCNNFQTALNPQIVKNVAVSNFERVHELMFLGTKISFILILTLSMPVIIHTDYILNIWLTEVPAHTSSFIQLTLCINLIHCAFANPLIFAINAVGDMKKFQLVEGGILISILPISYVLLKFYTDIPEIVFFVYLFIEIITQVARTLIVLPKIKMCIRYYFIYCLFPLLEVLICVTLSGLLLFYFLGEGTIVNFILATCISLIACLISFIYRGCNKVERQALLSRAKLILHKLKM